MGAVTQLTPRNVNASSATHALQRKKLDRVACDAFGSQATLASVQRAEAPRDATSTPTPTRTCISTPTRMHCAFSTTAQRLVIYN